ncbi:MAG TPA: Rne/Rng family ribonuclease [Polyangiaceae bacterium]|nr:Rne/Rng family ribonuclease [Polyangiaceae bacterium]
MPKNTLVINCDIRETRVALIEGGVIAELQIERANARGTVGNIVLGRVTRVLPGMQAAFIDVGMERAAFLHVEDLIRPNDLDAYLAGARRTEDADRWEKGDGGRRRIQVAVAEDLEDEDDDDDEEVVNGAVAAELEHDEDDEDDDEDEEPASVAPALENDDEDDEDASEASDEEEEEEEEEVEEHEVDSAEEDAAEALPEDEAEELEGSAETPTETARRKRRRRRRRGRENDSASNEKPTKARSANEGERSRESKRSTRASKNGREPRSRGGIPRVSRSVPITEVVKEGDEVIVQISKEPIGTKGARVTSHVSLAGRYVVYLPTVEHVGVSKRIGSARERARLREVVETLKPAAGGIIVRTVAEGLTKKDLKADIGYLVRLWEDVLKRREGAKAPAVLYTELDLVLKTARDLFTEEIESIVIDDKAEYARLVRFVEMFAPSRTKDIHYYSGDEPIFDAYGIEDEIARALSRKVPLPSGGYLIIDQAEALTAIDVNTGRFVGKGSKDLEETALKTNLEAVEEIAYQLRFRNIGGLVILDLIDMDAPGNREKVWRALEQRLAKDKAKTTINRISELGLIEMTRKRTRESLARMMHETCFYCDGTGQIQSRTTIAYEILRQIRRERHNLPGYSVVVNAHPAVVDLMTGEEREAVTEAERRYMRRIEFNPRREYHIEQFDLQGK